MDTSLQQRIQSADLTRTEKRITNKNKFNIYLFII